MADIHPVPSESMMIPVQGMDIEAPLPDLAATAAAAQAAGNAWQAGAAQWAESPQGAGVDGFGLSGDNPAGADGDWPTNLSFPHQGP